MGVLNKIFGSGKPEIEKLIENRFVTNLKQVGISRREIQEAIAQCKSDSKKEVTDNLPLNFGDYLIEHKFDNEKCKIIVEKAKLGGASEDDIKYWWNLDDLERRMIQWEDKMYRFASFLVFKQEGLSEGDAIMKVRKTFPIYGDPTDETNMQGDDRPLPDELHERIKVMTMELPPIYFQQFSSDYNSMNGFIRSELRMTRTEDN